MGAYSYSVTAASNTSIDGLGNNGAVDPPSNIDNLVARLAASDAALVRDLGGANTVGGTADAITVSLADPTAATAYFDGMRLSFRVGTDSTSTAPTLNVDSIGTKTIKKTIAGVESALIAGDLQAGQTAEVVYRSAWATAAGAFELLNPYSMNAGAIGIGVAPDTRALYISGASETSYAPTDSGTKASTLALLGGSEGVGSGGALVFGAFGNPKGWAAIKGYALDAANNTAGALSFSTRNSSTDSSFTERLTIGQTGSWRIGATDGSNGQVVKQVSGATAWGGVSTFATVQAATSGTAINFTSIPSWVREIDVMFDAVSLSGTDSFLVQLGDSGGLETSGYVSTSTNAQSSGNTSSTSGFVIRRFAAGDAHSGIMQIKNITGNVWVSSHSVCSDTSAGILGGGTKTLSATLDRLSVVPTGANSFDGSGQINICYR